MEAFVIFIVLVIMLVLFAIRNTLTCDVRLAFIGDAALWPQAYDALPSYNSMLFSPKHYLRWTKAQWVAYTKEQA